MSEDIDKIWQIWFERSFMQDSKLSSVPEILKISEIATKKIFQLTLTLAQDGTVPQEDKKFIEITISRMCEWLSLSEILEKLDLLIKTFEENIDDRDLLLSLLKNMHKIQEIVIPIYLGIQHEKSKRFERDLELLTVVNDAIIRAKSEEDLAKKVCKVAVDVGRCTGAWLCLFDDEKVLLWSSISHHSDNF